MTDKLIKVAAIVIVIGVIIAFSGYIIAPFVLWYMILPSFMQLVLKGLFWIIIIAVIVLVVSSKMKKKK